MNLKNLPYYNQIVKYKNHIYLNEELDFRKDYYADLLKAIGYKYNYGSSKFVIQDKDFVVKLPIRGISESLTETTKYRENYCYLEYENYLYAQNEGLDFLFAKTEMPEYDVYVQEKLTPYVEWKANTYDSKSYLKSMDIIKEQEKNNTRYAIYNSIIVATLISQYDDEVYKRLIKFCQKYLINDLTLNNFGFDKNGKLKIFDFSGYYGYEDSPC